MPRPVEENPEQPIDREQDEPTIRLMAEGERVFNRYRLIRVVGRGGMGVVWLAKDEELDREIALKFLPESVCLDRETTAALKRETRFSLELTHPNIVRIYDFVHDDRYAAIAMEFIDGQSLSALKSERPTGCFEVHEIAVWVQQLCAALDYAHSVGKVVHQDLKPANLMINSKGQLKITDFGIARTVSDSVARLTADGLVAGTLVFMSPQQMNGKRPTQANDIYSLGATIYDLLTSKPPFHSGALYQQIEHQIPRPMTQRRGEYDIKGQTIPKAWETTTAQCLAKLPEGRPASAAEVAMRLGLHGGTQATWVTKATGRPGVVGLWQTHRWAVGIAAVLLLAAMVFGILSRLPRSGSAVIPPAAPGSPAAPVAKSPLVPKRKQPALTQIAEASLGDRFTNNLGMVFVRMPGLKDTFFSIWETRVQDFAAFAKDASYNALSGVITTNGLNDGKQDVFGGNWASPGWPQGPNYPVGGLSRDDAVAFSAWLTELAAMEGQLPKSFVYRLPTDTEWSYAVGLTNETGTTPEERDSKVLGVYPWGTAWPPPQDAGSYRGEEDGFAHTSPVGSFPANRLGLFDLGGNVWEWCADPFSPKNLGDGTLRGGSFMVGNPDQILSSRRKWPGRRVAVRNFELGFRCVLAKEVPPAVRTGK